MVFFIIIKLFSAYGETVRTKQFVYDLSQMEREDALVIVRSIQQSYLLTAAQYPGGMLQYAYEVPPETVEAIMDRYLAEARAITAFDKFILVSAPTVFLASLAIAAITMILTIILGVLE